LLKLRRSQPVETLVRAGHLLDVHSGKLLDAQTIVVAGDKITAIAPTASTPAGAGILSSIWDR